MKNLFFVVAGAVLLMLSACSKSGDGINNGQGGTTTGNTSLLVAKWYYSTDSIKYYTNSKLDSTKVINYSVTSSDNIVFNANLTGTETRNNIANNFKYTLTSSQTIQFQFSSAASQSVKLKTDGLQTLASSGSTVTGTIGQLTDSNLILTFETVNGTQKTDEIAYFTK